MSTPSTAERIVFGWVAHLVTDWLLQNDWQARHKATLGHPAGFVHAGLHAAVQVPVFGARRSVGIGVAHYAIDLRAPLRYWGRLIRQTPELDAAIPASLHVLMWRDQVAHLAVIALTAILSRSEVNPA